MGGGEGDGSASSVVVVPTMSPAHVEIGPGHGVGRDRRVEEWVVDHQGPIEPAVAEQSLERLDELEAGGPIGSASRSTSKGGRFWSSRSLTPEDAEATHAPGRPMRHTEEPRQYQQLQEWGARPGSPQRTFRRPPWLRPMPQEIASHECRERQPSCSDRRRCVRRPSNYPTRPNRCRSGDPP